MDIKDTTVTRTEPHISTIRSLNFDFVTSTPGCPGPGETPTANSLVISAGGKGQIQAGTCGRLIIALKTEDAPMSDDVYYSTLLRPGLDASSMSTDRIEKSTEVRPVQRALLLNTLLTGFVLGGG